jgi:hypothetical protein
LVANPQDMLSKLGINAAALDRVRLAQSVVGKSSVVAALALIVLGIVGWSTHDATLPYMVCGLFAFYFIGVLWFAHKNPGLSLLEGAELIKWRQMEIGAKDGVPTPELSENAPAPPLVVEHHDGSA